MAKQAKAGAARRPQRGRRRERKNVPRGQAHVQATFNNTIVRSPTQLVTWFAGAALAQVASKAHAKALPMQPK